MPTSFAKRSPLFVDVMHVHATGLVYAMQAEDGKEVYGENASLLGSQVADRAVDFVKQRISSSENG